MRPWPGSDPCQGLPLHIMVCREAVRFEQALEFTSLYAPKLKADVSNEEGTR